MARKVVLGKKTVSLDTIWHAYVICGYCNYRHSVHTMVDEPMSQLLQNYLAVVYGDNEWAKKDVLDLIRDVSRTAIRTKARAHFPSIFQKRKAYPLEKPEELPNLDMHFDAIANLSIGLMTLKEERKPPEEEETSMSDKERPTTGPIVDFAGVKIQVTKLVKDGTKTKSGKDRLVPTMVTVDAGELTLDNFKEKTGRRFRMTKGQTERFGEHGQAQAFHEFLNEAVATVRNQRGD